MSVETRPCPPPPPRQKIPKDGWGPHGSPECYYTSHVLNSTARYVQFINKLRIMEEEIRIGKIDQAVKKTYSDRLHFFAKCHRKSQINNAQHRVEMCLKKYEIDLEEKRRRLSALLKADDERDLRRFVSEVQAGAEAAYQDKMDHLAYLLGKRKKEHEARFSATPLEKCAHVRPCITKIQAKEAEQIQLYQMREKQMRKQAEKEMDQMWYEVAMKEADALAARNEIAEINRLRREQQFLSETNLVIEDVRRRRQEERERLKQEHLIRKAMVEEVDQKDKFEDQKRNEFAKSFSKMIEDKKRAAEEDRARNEYISVTWRQLEDERSNEEPIKMALRKRKMYDLSACNKKMVDIKNHFEEYRNNPNSMILEEGQRIRDAEDLKRCIRRKESKIQIKENQKFILKQVEEKEQKMKSEVKMKEQAEYSNQLDNQLEALIKNKEMTDAQARKLYQNDLRDQIAYNNKLKERALQEESEQLKKYEAARNQYQEEIKEMLSRPFYSNGVNPFMKKMAKGLDMPSWCPCVKQNYCVKPTYCPTSSSESKSAKK